MTKNEIISEVVSTTDLTRSQATKAYDAIFKSIQKSLIKGESVSLRGFATIKVVKTKERISYLHGKQVPIQACSTARLKLSMELKRQMNQSL